MVGADGEASEYTAGLAGLGPGSPAIRLAPMPQNPCQGTGKTRSSCQAWSGTLDARLDTGENKRSFGRESCDRSFAALETASALDRQWEMKIGVTVRTTCSRIRRLIALGHQSDRLQAARGYNSRARPRFLQKTGDG